MRKLLGIMGLLMILSSCSVKIVGVYYPLYKDARLAGAVRIGWIPASLVPESATEIHERHHLDTGAAILGFSFAPEDRAHVVSGCTPIPREELVAPTLDNRKWWPRELVSPESAPPNYSFFHCEAENGYLAVDEQAHQAFFWRP